METIGDIVKKQWRNKKNKEWMAKHPEKREQYYKNRKQWKKEHRALLDYRKRLRHQDPEYRKLINNRARKWREGETYKRWYKKYLAGHPKPNNWETGQVLMWWGARCIECGCKFRADAGIGMGRRWILCNDCMEEMESHDEAPYAPREIIDLYHELGWAAAEFTLATEYRKNLGYYYCPE